MKSFVTIIILCFLAIHGLSQDYSIKGRVIDKVSGHPLKNVNIIVAGESQGTITDPSGYFVLSLSSANTILVVSHVTYETQPVAIKQDNNVVIIPLEKRILELPEIELATSYKKLSTKSYEPWISTEDQPQPGQMFDLETNAEFPYAGGVTTFLNFLELTFQYPVNEVEEGENGKAVLIFTINQKGNYTAASCQSGNVAICNELKRTLTLLPGWNPARQRGEPVEQTMKLTVDF